MTCCQMVSPEDRRISPTPTDYSGLLTVSRQKELRCVLLRQPSDLVDLLLDLKAFQVVKLGLVALEGAVNIVLSSALWLTLTLNNDRARIRVKFKYHCVRDRVESKSQCLSSCMIRSKHFFSPFQMVLTA